MSSRSKAGGIVDIWCNDSWNLNLDIRQIYLKIVRIFTIYAQALYPLKIRQNLPPGKGVYVSSKQCANCAQFLQKSFYDPVLKPS